MDISGMIISALKTATGYVISAALQNQLIMAAVLMVFILAMRYIFHLLKEALIVAVIAGIFPVILVQFFNAPIELSIETFLSYIIMGEVLFLVYHILKSIFKKEPIRK